jgi:hypothetical protein
MSSKVEIFKIGNKQLNIDESKVYWENKLFEGAIEHPTELRYGTQPIELDMFTIGTSHRIELRNANKEKLTISVKSYFGIRRREKFSLYQQIADMIWDNFFEKPFEKIVTDWESGQTISIGRFIIDQNGLTKKGGSDGITMSFDEIQMFHRYDHLLINSKIKVDKFMKLMYLEDWNWPIIHEILCRKVESRVGG